MKQKRWIPAVAGTVILLFAGLVYAWSTLSVPIAQEFPNWTEAQRAMSFTLVIVFFCLGGLANGVITKKVKPHWSLAASAVLLLIGFLLGAATKNPLSLHLSFGVCCGTAAGLAYNTVLGTVGKWFPDKPGLISGILLMGFGFSAFLVGKAYQAWTPEVIGAWRTSFVVLGVAVCAVTLLCAPLIRRPGAEYAGKALKNEQSSEDYTAGRMVRSVRFWLYYFWSAVLTASSLALISQGSGMAAEVGTTVSPASIATTVGLLSIFNGVGRVLSGHLFDRIGRKHTMNVVNGFFVLATVLLMTALLTQIYTLLVLGFVFAGLGYGGIPPITSAYTNAAFGQKHYPVNYPIAVTNMVPASVGSTIAGALFDATGSFLSCCWMMVILTILGIALSLILTAAERKK